MTIGGTRITFRTIQAAILDRNGQLRLAGAPLLDPSVVRARLALGWPAEEALEYRPHEDGRGARAEFRFGECLYSSLRAAAAATGLATDTLRSRLHRADAGRV